MEEKNVQVSVRCRPLSKKEKDANRATVVQCNQKTNELVVRKRTYTFDKVFGPYTTQKEVFKSMIQPVVDEALMGFNCTVFAYGQTGTGKTHTIQGSLDPENEMAGIIPRAVRYIFDHLQQNYQDYSVRVSYLQLYNEELSDLLSTSEPKKLRLMEDVKKGGVYCQNLQEVPAVTSSDVFALLERGVKNRYTAETALNENSSRSHSIFTLKLHTKETVPGGEDLLKTGTLNLVDLAGSECIGRSGARHSRAREAGNINQSLLTLGRVITALVDKHPHVPYRDSKLTRLLQESLGGKAKTTIIATLAPCADNIDETASTLEYAHRAKNIKNRPEANQRMTKHALLKDFGQEIDDLRMALQCARDKDGIFLDPAKFQEMQERLAGQKTQIEELEEVMEARQEEFNNAQLALKSKDEELVEKTKVLREVETNLETTQQHLDKVETSLKETQGKLDLSTKIVQAYHENEVLNMEKNEIGGSLYQSSRHDIDVLQTKIQRHWDIEHHNSNNVSAFVMSQQDTLTKMNSNLEINETAVHALITSAIQQMNETVKLNTKENSNMIGECQEMGSTVQEIISNITASMSEGKENLLKHHDEIESWREAHLNLFQNKMVQLEKVVVKNLETTVEVMNANDKQVKSQLTQIVQLLGHCQTTMVNSTTKQKELLSRLESFYTVEFDKQLKSISLQREQMTSIGKNQAQEFSEKLNVLRQGMTDMLNDFDVAQRASVQSSTQSLKQSSKQIYSEMEALKSSGTAQILCNANTMEANAENHLKELQTLSIMASGVTELREQHAIVEKHQSMESYHEIQQSLQQMVAENKETITVDLGAKLIAQEKTITNVHDQIQQVSAQSCSSHLDQISAMKSKLGSASQDVQHRGAVIEEQLLETNKIHTLGIRDQQDQMMAQSKEMEAMTLSMKMDTPTGKTPKKQKEYGVFPQFYAADVPSTTAVAKVMTPAIVLPDEQHQEEEFPIDDKENINESESENENSINLRKRNQVEESPARVGVGILQPPKKYKRSSRRTANQNMTEEST